ncbi:MAG: helix-turn-helix transcriptional regulator [Paracoccus sp. (in: a-proteobacteria)]|nr:helix-turn-helix transcriptional regulator [Paracoccus sp. (in: a-proteobacteria)]
MTEIARDVTITREEYDRLLVATDDLADLDAYDRAKAADGISIPDEAVGRIFDGESPLRVFRELRGLSQAALGREAGVNRVQINDIEAGRSNGSVATLQKLAAALRVSLDDLV